MDTFTENFLIDTIVDYMRQGGMFTSLDITNQAKDAGHQVRNYQVADWLRKNAISIAAAQSYLYNQSLITVDSKVAGPTLAYVYHHYMDDTDDYLDRDQNPKSFTSNPGNPADGGGVPVTQHPLVNVLHSSNVQLPVTYFRSRELARDFVRAHNDYKFQDNGAPNGNKRWSCVPR